MSHKDELRTQRYGTVINRTSSKQEKALIRAIRDVESKLVAEFAGIQLGWSPSVKLIDIIASLRSAFPEIDFASPLLTSAMKPDGGILSIVDKKGQAYPILITEKKNQGTNDLRLLEGKKKQAQGNAIERLGKNVIGFRTSMLGESIFPFVCFGDGCDFAPGSSIIDRVITIAMFGELNSEHLHNQGKGGVFNRGSFYFRAEEWTMQEMADISYSIAKKSIYYYFSKYGEEQFK